MIRKPHVDIQDFSYELPDRCIAQFPLEERDGSKLLVWKDHSLTEEVFRNIDQHLPSDSLMIFNDTRVVKARLYFRKPTGGAIEIFCLEPMDAQEEQGDFHHGKGIAYWQCLIGNAKRWKEGKIGLAFLHHGANAHLWAERGKELGDGCFTIRFSWKPEDISFREILERAGHVPLPPYIQRAAKTTDVSHYQTIYALHDGSVAAPTAGLHFSPAVMEKLHQRNISQQHVTLHVGLGTFRPVSARYIADHPMHEEQIVVDTSTLREFLNNLQKPFIAVGTTSVRTLESLYWTGVKLLIDKPNTLPTVQQWDPYDDRYQQGITLEESWKSLLHYLEDKTATQFVGRTRLLIAPGYTLNTVAGMITNFHLPQSTLLLLIASFMGSEWRQAYYYAIEHDFRFLSYGDACLLLKTK